MVSYAHCIVMIEAFLKKRCFLCWNSQRFFDYLLPFVFGGTIAKVCFYQLFPPCWILFELPVQQIGKRAITVRHFPFEALIFSLRLLAHNILVEFFQEIMCCRIMCFIIFTA